MPFTFNKIHLDSETTAEQLRTARQQKKLKLENVAKKLNINLKYLKALESGNYDKLPAGTYGKNFLREYCLFLGLDYNEILKLFEHEISIGQKKGPSIFSGQIVKKRFLWAVPKLIRNIVIVVLIAICLIYLNFYLRNINSQPRLNISNPPEYLVTSARTIEVIGSTEIGVNIKINGESTLTDAVGSFSQMINLNSGINTITITAERKFGRANEIKRQVLVKEENSKQY